MTGNERVGDMTREQWRTTEAARATSSIACNRCGQCASAPTIRDASANPQLARAYRGAIVEALRRWWHRNMVADAETSLLLDLWDREHDERTA